jgi:hypothetical protein
MSETATVAKSSGLAGYSTMGLALALGSCMVVGVSTAAGRSALWYCMCSDQVGAVFVG